MLLDHFCLPGQEGKIVIVTMRILGLNKKPVLHTVFQWI